MNEFILHEIPCDFPIVDFLISPVIIFVFEDVGTIPPKYNPIEVHQLNAVSHHLSIDVEMGLRLRWF